LSLDACQQLRLLDFYDQVPRLEVSRYGDVDVEVADRLRPLVRKGGLLGLLLGLGGCLFLLGGLYGEKSVAGYWEQT